MQAGPENGSGGPPTAPAADFMLTFPEFEAKALAQYYSAGRTILEYGSGGSTVMAARAGCSIITVESDRDWAARMTAHLAPISDKARVHHVDIGPTGARGAPVNARGHRNFHAYALSVWDRADFETPDLVLIDGRFRASCLIAVRLRATRTTTVLFDDYLNRSHYHGVEALADLEEMIGRMARFTVTPGPIPPEMMTEAIGWFVDPR